MSARMQNLQSKTNIENVFLSEYPDKRPLQPGYRDLISLFFVAATAAAALRRLFFFFFLFAAAVTGFLLIVFFLTEPIFYGHTIPPF